MAHLIKYTLLLMADLVIIGCVVHFCASVLRWHTPVPLEPHHRASRSEKIQHYFYYAVVVLGFGLALYGSLIFLFSWMPHSWVSYDEDEVWMAQLLSVIGAFGGTGALINGLETTASKISELQNREARADAFRKLIERILDQSSWAVRGVETATDMFAKLEREIGIAENTGTIYIEQARACRHLVSALRQAAER